MLSDHGTEVRGVAWTGEDCGFDLIGAEPGVHGKGQKIELLLDARAHEMRTDDLTGAFVRDGGASSVIGPPPLL